MCADRFYGPQTKATTAGQKEKALQRLPLAARKLDRDTNEQELQPATAQAAPGQFAWTLATLPILPPEASRSVRSPSRLPGSGILQTKLEIGAVDDPLEREADAVADRVMRMVEPAPSVSAAPPPVSRKCAACEEEEKKVQMKPAGAARSIGAAPPTVHEALREPGRPLDPATRAFFEPRFARDFGGVRVHTGDLAERSAQELGADAYTVASDIVFRANRFAPDTDPGRRLLAHELTHVTQQSQTREKDSAFGKDSQTLRRKLKADKAGEPAPGTPAAGTARTRAEVVEDYLRKLSPGGAPTVDRASGEIKLADSFCHKRGFFGRIGHGFLSGVKTGAGIGVYALGIGALPGALIGGLIGAVVGAFGADCKPRSPRRQRAPPASATSPSPRIPGPSTSTTSRRLSTSGEARLRNL